MKEGYIPGHLMATVADAFSTPNERVKEISYEKAILRCFNKANSLLKNFACQEINVGKRCLSTPSAYIQINDREFGIRLTRGQLDGTDTKHPKYEKQILVIAHSENGQEKKLYGLNREYLTGQSGHVRPDKVDDVFRTLRFLEETLKFKKRDAERTRSYIGGKI